MMLRDLENFSSSSQPIHSTLGHRYVPHTSPGIRSQQRLNKSTLFSAFKAPLSSPAPESSSLSSMNGAATGADRSNISNIGNAMEYTNSGLAGRVCVDGYGKTSPADDTADAPRADYTYMSQQEQGQLDKEGGHHTQDEGYVHNRIVSEGKRHMGSSIPFSTRSRMESETGAVRGDARRDGVGARTDGGFRDMAKVAAEIPPVDLSSAGYDIDSDEVGEGMGIRTGDEDHPGQEGREGTQGVLRMAEAGQGQGPAPTWSETKTKVRFPFFWLPLLKVRTQKSELRVFPSHHSEHS